MKNADSKESSQHCSRCGYDLTGLISGWRDRCPFRERGMEGGMQTDWCDQFSAALLPGWYVESGPGFLRGLVLLAAGRGLARGRGQHRGGWAAVDQPAEPRFSTHRRVFVLSLSDPGLRFGSSFP
jgi:hypothetical protein